MHINMCVSGRGCHFSQWVVCRAVVQNELTAKTLEGSRGAMASPEGRDDKIPFTCPIFAFPPLTQRHKLYVLSTVIVLFFKSPPDLG